MSSIQEKNMLITALTENTSEKALGTEHGLSLYIETREHTVLFDMGQSGLFSKNAVLLEKDLSKVDVAVLSHGHYDHGGGLSRFLELNDKASVYINKFAFEPHYNGTERYIGLDTALKYSPRFIFTDGATKIADGLTLYSSADISSGDDFTSYGLNMLSDGEFVTDDFRHEQYLLIEENGKRILISGCSHKGIVSITRHFMPDILVGGFHFKDIPVGEKLAKLSDELDSLGVMYYTCHCTGAEQYMFIKNRIKSIDYISTGKTIEI